LSTDKIDFFSLSCAYSNIKRLAFFFFRIIYFISYYLVLFCYWQ
jgi:hypothetical protein